LLIFPASKSEEEEEEEEDRKEIKGSIQQLTTIRERFRHGVCT
jgi:hypothetical protein